MTSVGHNLAIYHLRSADRTVSMQFAFIKKITKRTLYEIYK